MHACAGSPAAYDRTGVAIGKKRMMGLGMGQVRRMTMAVMMAVERRIGINGADKLWLPWEDRYQVVADVERPPIVDYRKVSKVRTDTVSNPLRSILRIRTTMLNFADSLFQQWTP